MSKAVTPIKTYTNWAINMLVGGNPEACDRFLKENFFTIHKVAQDLYHDIEVKTIYRGVLMDENITELKPHEALTYLSFSESKDVATHFGNNVDGFPCLKKFKYGYVIEYTPRKDEILFHWSLFNRLPIIEIVEASGISAKTMPLQKEVTIVQPKESLPVKKWDDFYPDYDRLCLGHPTSSFLDVLLGG